MEKIRIKDINDELLAKFSREVDVSNFSTSMLVSDVQFINSIESKFYDYFELGESDVCILNKDLFLFAKNPLLTNIFKEFISKYKIVIIQSIAEHFVNKIDFQSYIESNFKDINTKFLLISADVSLYNGDVSKLILPDEKSFISFWKPWIFCNNQIDFDNVDKLKKEYKFTSMHGKSKWFRDVLVNYLILLDYTNDKNIITYHKENIIDADLKLLKSLGESSYYSNQNDIITKHNQTIDDILLHEINTISDVKYSKNITLTKQSQLAYYKSYCNIFCEFDFFYNNECMKLTEKTFFPMYSKNVMFSFGQNQHYFKKLKEYGFHTFDDINYINTESDSTRDILTAQYHKLKKLKNINIVEYYNDNDKHINNNFEICKYYFLNFNWTEHIRNLIISNL